MVSKIKKINFLIFILIFLSLISSVFAVCENYDFQIPEVNKNETCFTSFAAVFEHKSCEYNCFPNATLFTIEVGDRLLLNKTNIRTTYFGVVVQNRGCLDDFASMKIYDSNGNICKKDFSLSETYANLENAKIAETTNPSQPAIMQEPPTQNQEQTSQQINNTSVTQSQAPLAINAANTQKNINAESSPKNTQTNTQTNLIENQINSINEKTNEEKTLGSAPTTIEENKNQNNIFAEKTLNDMNNIDSNQNANQNELNANRNIALNSQNISQGKNDRLILVGISILIMAAILATVFFAEKKSKKRHF